MEFFKTIADFLQDGQQVQMAIRKSGDNIAVSILPDNRGVKDKAVENITPLVMSGTPEEFEEGFKDALKPLAAAQGLVSNIKEFEENTEKAKKESEMAKKLKDEAAKQKKEFNDLIALARKNKDEHKFKDARVVLAKAQALPSAEKAIIDKEYYKQLTEEAKENYEKARRLYASYADANSEVVLASYRTKLDDLENDMQLKFNNYTAMTTQYQAALARVQERTPAFTMIKGATVPYKPTGPKRMIFVAGMLIFATILLSLYVTIKK